MINVTKKELTPRVFIPYEITISITNAEEHKILVKEIKELGKLTSSAWYRFQKNYGALFNLVKEIKNHTL